MIIFRTCLIVVVVIALHSTAVADEFEKNWHQFRGPTGNGIAIDASPPIKWSADNAKWKTAIPGKGSASPVVWGDKIFILTAVETKRKKEDTADKSDKAKQDSTKRGGRSGRGGRGGRRMPMNRAAPTNYFQFKVVCINRKTGKEIWTTDVHEAVPHEGRHNTNTYASGSPVTDGKHVWVSFNSFGLYCLDMDGNVKWDRQFGKMRTRVGFGEGASPALHDNTLVINWDHEDQSFIEAINATTGKTKWKENRDERTTWSTPTIVEHKGRTQVITNGAKRVRSYDLANGELIWECGGQTGNPIPTPIVFDGMTVCMTGFRANAAMGIPLDSQGDVTGTDKISWSRRDIGPYVATGVLYQGKIYSTKGRDAVLTSIDAKTGKTVIDATRLSGIRSLYASMVAAADHIYITGRNGTTLVLKHGDTLDIVESNQLGEPVDATPAIVGKQIFIRSDKHLYCFENK